MVTSRSKRRCRAGCSTGSGRLRARREAPPITAVGMADRSALRADAGVRRMRAKDAPAGAGRRDAEVSRVRLSSAAGRTRGSAVASQFQSGWNYLQGGDTHAADRTFTAVLKSMPGLYPAEAALGYSALAKARRAECRHALRSRAGGQRRATRRRWPAKVTRSWRSAGPIPRWRRSKRRWRRTRRYRACEAAPTCCDSKARSRRSRPRAGPPKRATSTRRARRTDRDCRVAGQRVPVSRARDGGEAGRRSHGRDGARATRRHPRSERRARADARRGDSRSQQGLAEGCRRLCRSQRARAGRPAGGTCRRDARTRRVRRRCPKSTGRSRARRRSRAPSWRLSSAVHLEDLLRRARAGNAVVITDARDSWASPWIQAVTRAGVMDVFPNHTFQPTARCGAAIWRRPSATS